MATYTFETMTTAQALAYQAASDTLVFSDQFIGASGTYVLFNPAGDGPETVTIKTGGGLGRTLEFGTGIEGETSVFQNGSRLFIGSAANDLFLGGTQSDGEYGGAGNDTLTGEGGDDVIDGGPGHDVMTGGAGSDTFFVRPGESGLVSGQTDVITDWQSVDKLAISPTDFGVYYELTAPDFAAGLAAANSRIAVGGTVVAVQIGADVVVFADTYHDVVSAGDAVVLTGRTLADVDESNFISIPSDARPATAPTRPPGPPAPPSQAPTPAEPVLPHAPAIAAGGISGRVDGNLDGLHLSDLIGAGIDESTATRLSLGGDGVFLQLTGTGFTYDANQQLTGGTATAVLFGDSLQGASGTLSLTLHPLAATQFLSWVPTDATQLALNTVLAGNDTISGGPGDDLIRGFGGDDVLYGSGGFGGDTIFGGAGNDQIYALVPPFLSTGAPSGPNYLRGEDGDDYIIGGAGFDDINGNMGNDTVSGGPGDDWSVGGKDNDLLFGDAGDDIVWGNLGNDTIDGGAGNDQVRGGQGDDWVFGGAGNDYVSGDRGNDTIVGGAGADLFHGSQDAGIDRVLDFNASEGDRVMLDPGTTYTISQQGADTVIDMGGGNEMILVGVQLSSLPAGSIFLG